MDDFTRAYIECALWSEKDDAGEPFDKNYTIADIAPEDLAQMQEDCAAFSGNNPLPSYRDQNYTDAELAGHDFWLTRNHHGVGFWDRGLGEQGDTLTDAAHQFGECNLYVGDDGRIYIA